MDPSGASLKGQQQRLNELRTQAKAAAAVGPVHAHLFAHLIAEGELFEALEQFEQARYLPVRSADAHEALAFYAQRLGLHEASNAHYRAAVALEPASARLWHNLATSERSLGRLMQAVEACNRALALGADPYPTLLLRSECARISVTQNHVQELSEMLERTSEARQQMFLGYALGKELHDLGDYDRAFAAFSTAASSRRINLNYDVEIDRQKMARITEVFSEATKSKPLGDKPADHIFIVGLPRSGTTLIERIVSGLRGVHSNGETDNFFNALIRAAPRSGKDIFTRCAQSAVTECETWYRKLSNPRGLEISIVEKLPLNYLYVGAIARNLGRSRIIWVNRDPIDSCFAMWRTLFAEAYPFSYDFEDLAAYHASYKQLQRHWEGLTQGLILNVDYESLVASPAAVGRAIAAHCGLDWNETATDISRVKMASLTASATQVRGGIYTRSSGIWKRYEQHLYPLQSALDRHHEL